MPITGLSDADHPQPAVTPCSRVQDFEILKDTGKQCIVKVPNSGMTDVFASVRVLKRTTNSGSPVTVFEGDIDGDGTLDKWKASFQIGDFARYIQAERKAFFGESRDGLIDVDRDFQSLYQAVGEAKIAFSGEPATPESPRQYLTLSGDWLASGQTVQHRETGETFVIKSFDVGGYIYVADRDASDTSRPALKDIIHYHVEVTAALQRTDSRLTVRHSNIDNLEPVRKD